MPYGNFGISLTRFLIKFVLVPDTTRWSGKGTQISGLASYIVGRPAVAWEALLYRNGVHFAISLLAIGSPVGSRPRLAFLTLGGCECVCRGFSGKVHPGAAKTIKTRERI